MNQTLTLYRKLGPEAFGNAVTALAPYFATIDPEFTELRPGYAELRFANRHAVHNHIGTVHAIALCNAAELAAGTMTAASIADGRQWIPVGMQVRYLAKARTDMRVVARGEQLAWERSGDIDVPVDAFDAGGERVFTAIITMNLK